MSKPITEEEGRRCFVCSGDPHEDRTSVGGHRYWSTADALAEARAADAQTQVRYSTGATTPEAAYVEQHRPY